MRIIIEGCDKSGKSTLVEALKNEIPSLIGLKLLTKPRDNSDTSKAYIKKMYVKMAQMTMDPGAHYLFDRWYPSEMVYSFKRKYEAMNDPWFWSFEKELRNSPVLYVLLDVDRKLVTERFKKDNEQFAKADEIIRIQKRYRKHFAQCQLNKLVIDPTDNLDGAIQQIREAMDAILNPKMVDFSTDKKIPASAADFETEDAKKEEAKK